MGKKLNALMVSGLTIGPVLGSGIIFLPPLAYEKLGENSILAWVIMMALGGLFAYVFTKMAVIAPNNAGISAIVGKVLGDPFRELSANYLTLAVLFGPVVVALTAGEFLEPLFSNGIHQITLAAIVLVICALMVLSGAAFMAKVMLVLSSLTACLLLAGSLAVLWGLPATNFPHTFPNIASFGQVLLLIFWAIFGWEVLGNYVEEVADPSRTMMQAMKISLLGIVSVYLVTSYALQNSPAGGMAGLLFPLLGKYASVVFGVLSAALCICTIVAFTGAVARQTSERLQVIRLPKSLQKKWISVLLLLMGNLLVLGFVASGWFSFENVIEVANMLFIGNAFLGLICGFRLMPNVTIRIGISVLLVIMAAVAAFLPLNAIIFFLLVTGISLLWSYRNSKRMSCVVHDSCN